MSDWEAKLLATKGKAIAECVPAQWIEVLRQMDGTTLQGPYRYEREVQPHEIRDALDYLGLVDGTAGSSVSGFDAVVWLTPLGQAVVDASRPREGEDG